MNNIPDPEKEKINGRLTNIACFNCGGFMRVRLARKGKNAGNLFLGCENFPNCKGSAEMPDNLDNIFDEDPEEEFLF